VCADFVRLNILLLLTFYNEYTFICVVYACSSQMLVVRSNIRRVSMKYMRVRTLCELRPTQPHNPSENKW